MKLRSVARWSFTGLTVLFGPTLSVNLENLVTRAGYANVLADTLAPLKGRSAILAALLSPNAIFPALVIAGVAVGFWLDLLAKRFDDWRESRDWWHGLHSFSVKSFACLVAKIDDEKFETSPRARGVANEIMGYLNSGHMPTMLERKEVAPSRLRLQELYVEGMSAPYAVKRVGVEAIVLKSDLESLARARQWELPWQIPPKKETGVITSPNLSAGIQSLVDIGLKKRL